MDKHNSKSDRNCRIARYKRYPGLWSSGTCIIQAVCRLLLRHCIVYDINPWDEWKYNHYLWKLSACALRQPDRAGAADLQADKQKVWQGLGILRTATRFENYS